MKAAIAIARRDFQRYFTSPTGYVFITVFIALGAFAQFWDEGFFDRNLANLSMLNARFPIILLFFIPAVAMTAWADERRHGTDELLLTMPVKDSELVVGKYLAALGIYGVSLIFSLSHVAVLRYLGHPDYGLMISTYFGYFLLGAALLPIAMIGSLLTESPTVAFIVGGMLCAVPVLWSQLSGLVGDTIGSAGIEYGFRDFADGVVSLRGLAYFGAMTAVGLFVNFHLLHRRRSSRAGVHAPVRVICLLACAAAFCVLSGRVAARQDMTEERLHTLTKQAREILQSIPADRPVSIQAFISPEVPESYVQTRENLVAALREFAAVSRGRVFLKIEDTTRASDAARDADSRFAIRPVRVDPGNDGEIFLGVSFTSGADYFVIPFFYRGWSVEYELARSVRRVIRGKRARIGVLSTELKWMGGGADYRTGRSTPPSSIVEELKKQYDVTEIQPDDLKKRAAEPDPPDVLIVPMASTLAQPQLDALREYVAAGRPVLFLDDPLPAENHRQHLSPNSPQRSAEGKGDASTFYRSLGFSWEPAHMAWDVYNPLAPPHNRLPREFVFVGSASAEGFSKSSSITSGLQLMVMIYAGNVTAQPIEGLASVPLLRGSEAAGVNLFNFNESRQVYQPGGELPTLALKVQGKIKPLKPGDKETDVNAIFVADVDFVDSEFIHTFRREGIEDLNFDNITFFLNCVDALAGDQGFIDLRKRRPVHRTLRTIEELRQRHMKKAQEEIKKAEKEEGDEIEKANAEFNKLAQEISREKGDAIGKMERMAAVREVEERKLKVKIAQIKDKRAADVSRSEAQRDREVRSIQDGLRLLAIVLPPIPALAFFFLSLYRRVLRELEARR